MKTTHRYIDAKPLIDKYEQELACVSPADTTSGCLLEEICNDLETAPQVHFVKDPDFAKGYQKGYDEGYNAALKRVTEILHRTTCNVN